MNEKTIFALGCFDGVHLGHAALLAKCRELARQQQCKSGVVTFAGHPGQLLSGVAPELINTPQDRNYLLRHCFSIDKVESLVFDEALMCTPWEQFLNRLVQELGAAGFVCGSDFRFGHKGQGDARLLQQYCQQHDMPCAVVPQQSIDGIRVSSTYIRSLLSQGCLEQAEAFLGHPHILTGTVSHGNQIGRTIGVPTANIAYDSRLVQLPLGVYACTATVEGKTYCAVTNIGIRPTVAGNHITVEAHILDFSLDIYGKKILLAFHSFLRPEQKFRDLPSLKKQIENDKKIVENTVFKK